MFYFYEISYDENISNIFYKIWYAAYCICRLSIYLVYIYRLHSIFATSAYNHSQTVYILIGVACIISVSCTFAVTFVGDSFTLHRTNQRIVFILESAYGVMDFSIIILLIYLFLKPIFALLKLMSSTDIRLQEPQTTRSKSTTKRTSHTANHKQLRLLDTATKLTVLMMISLISSFVYTFIWVISVGLRHQSFELYMFQYSWGIDTSINCICLYLSYFFANYGYRKICREGFGFHPCCLRSIKYFAHLR